MAPHQFHLEVGERVEELWSEAAPEEINHGEAQFYIEDGELNTTPAGHVFLTAFAKTYLKELVDPTFEDRFVERLSRLVAEELERSSGADQLM